MVNRVMGPDFDQLGFSMNGSSSSMDISMLGVQNQMHNNISNGTSRLPLQPNGSFVSTRGTDINTIDASSPSSGSVHFSHNLMSPNNPNHFQMLPNNTTNGIGTNLLSPISPDDMWMDSLMSSNPDWLNGYDFDLDALNNCVLTSMDNAEPLFQPQIPYFTSDRDFDHDSEREAERLPKQRHVNERIRTGWYTHIPELPNVDDTTRGTATGQITPVTGGSQYDVGEEFCRRVSQKLKSHTHHDDPPPSATFLVSTSDLFFNT